MGQNNRQLEQTTTVLRSFWKIQRRFVIWGQASAMNSGLSMPQYWILQSIPPGQFISQKYLGERMLFPKSTLSASIDGLVSAGLLKRIIPEENRREVQLQLTEAGEQKVQQIHDDPNGVYQKMDRTLAQLPQESVDALVELHHQLYELLMAQEEASHDGGDSRC